MIDDSEINALLDEQGNPNRVTPETIEKLLNEANIEEAVLHGKCLVVSYELKNGFTIRGEGSVVDKRYFNLDIGRKVARQNAENQLWQLEGYRLQQRLYDSGVLS